MQIRAFGGSSRAVAGSARRTYPTMREARVRVRFIHRSAARRVRVRLLTTLSTYATIATSRNEGCSRGEC